MIAGAAYLLGALLIVSRPLWFPLAAGVSKLNKHLGPERMYGFTIYNLNRFSDLIHWIELPNLRSWVASVLLPTALLVGAGVLSAPGFAPYRVGMFRGKEVPLKLAFSVVAATAITATLTWRAPDAGAGALEHRLHAGGDLRLLRRAERRPSRGPDRDHADASPRRHAQADPRPRPRASGGAAAAPAQP